MAGVLPTTSGVLATANGALDFVLELWVDFTTFSPAPPHSYNLSSGTMSSSLVNNTHSNRKALYHDQDGSTGSNPGGFFGTSNSYDLTNYSTFHYATKFNPDGPYDQFEVHLGGTTILSVDSDNGSHGWTNRTYDVSGLSGSQTLEIGHNVSQNNNRSVDSYVVDAYFD